MHNDISDWRGSFPSQHEPRTTQVEAINFALNEFLNNNKKYVVLESPTGTGKSHIAVTLANYFHSISVKNKSYILTTQLILQQQYKKEFPACANISSRRNYTCGVFNDSSCADMKWLHQFSDIPYCDNCVYENVKQKFLQNYCSITNTAFFMSNLQYNEELIKDRNLLVVDECHNLQEQIIKYKAIQIEFNMLKSEYGYRSEDWVTDKEDPMNWIQTKFRSWLQDKKSSLSAALQNKTMNFAKSKLLDVSKKYDFLDKLLCQLNRMTQMYRPARWVVEAKSEQKVVKITPLYAYDFAEEMMFSKGAHVLLMSGTILNKDIYCDNLGINKDQCAFLSLDSSFPKKNRPVFLMQSGSMSKKNMESSIDKVVADIKKILKLHSGQKGIIHVSSHKLASLIVQKVQSQRLVVVQDFNNRDDMLQYHYDTHDDSVLISPSLMEGLDLKGDLSRFQIIAKVPFPNLGDKYISTKKEVIPNWYSYQTVKAIVQSYGRSVRSDDDYACTYILDSDFLWVLKYNNKMFPKYFKQAISYGTL